MRAAARYFAVLAGVGAAVFMVLATLIRNVNVGTGVVSDGLGRTLEVPPWWARLFLTRTYEWAGLGWMFVDAVVAFGGAYAAFSLYNWGAAEAKLRGDNEHYAPSVSDLLKDDDRVH